MSLVDVVSSHLFNDGTKKAIIDEKTEEKVLSAIYDVVEEVMKKVLGA